MDYQSAYNAGWYDAEYDQGYNPSRVNSVDGYHDGYHDYIESQQDDDLEDSHPNHVDNLWGIR